MKPAEPFLAIPRSESPALPEPGRAAEIGRADSPVARVIASAVLCAALASIVWYVVEAVLAL